VNLIDPSVPGVESQSYDGYFGAENRYESMSVVPTDLPKTRVFYVNKNQYFFNGGRGVSLTTYDPNTQRTTTDFFNGRSSFSRIDRDWESAVPDPLKG
jgi:hypothetical protein